MISIHSPLAGRDGHRSLWDRLFLIISIHSPLAGRDDSAAELLGVASISIHSPLAGRDQGRVYWCERWDYFNPLAPRGARLGDAQLLGKLGLFQSTRPSRGETGCSRCAQASGQDFNPLAPRGARPGMMLADNTNRKDFNPLAPRGARRPRNGIWRRWKSFQSTRPSRGETLPYQGRQFSLEISIHSPLAGRDGERCDRAAGHGHFNPLAPRGARRSCGCWMQGK